MRIQEVSQYTGLTKKAIVYDVEQGLVCPAVLENGYRDFSGRDVERLEKIAVLRRLGLGTEEIRQALDDETGSALQAAAVRKELRLQWERARNILLDKLSGGADYAVIRAELQAAESGRTIAERLLDAFPGYYGRFICLHFSRFLNEPVTTDEQRAAYTRILAFLDDLPPLNLPEELQDYLMEGTKELGVSQITGIIDSARASIADPDTFLEENRETLEQYLAYRQSEEYRNSPACRLMAAMREFNSASGYNDVFLPALKTLSPSYAAYCRQMEAANDKLLAAYPAIEGLE